MFPTGFGGGYFAAFYFVEPGEGIYSLNKTQALAWAWLRLDLGLGF